MSQSTKIYEFGPFRVEVSERTLLENGKPSSLTPKGFETLLVLLDNTGHVLTKSELMQRVWPDSFVDEATLAKNIHTLRKVLHDDQEQPKYIQTVPKVGYRFVAPVSVPDDGHSTLPTAAKPAKRLAAALLALALAVGVSVYAVWNRGFAKQASSARVGLAVLPFQNLSGDSTQDFISDGLTDEIITDLGSLDPSRLGVIARTSAMLYKNSPKSAHQIGQDLGVEYLLEGSVRREGNQLRVTAQLVRTSDQTHLWASSYDRDMSHILALQNEIAGTVASHIAERLDIRATETKSRPPNPEAYELYLEGRHFWNRRTPDAIARAILVLQGAIARDPGFARAHAALADCYVIQNIYSLTPHPEAFVRAREEASTALALDPSLADAYATRGYAHFFDWNFAAAEADFQKSIQLAPRYAIAHQWYGEYLRFIGHQQEAMVESRRALESDPLSPIINVEAAMPYYYLRDYDRAIAQLRHTVELDPYFASAHGHLARVYDAKGMYREALQEILTAKSLGDAPWIESWLAIIQAHLGHPEQTRRLLRKFRNEPQAANLYLALGEREEALKVLERTYSEHHWELTGLKVEPEVDPLRSDPRFQAVLDGIRFPN